MNGTDPIRRGDSSSPTARSEAADEPSPSISSDAARTLVTSVFGGRWPEGLPRDRELDRRVGFELSRTSVRKELGRRFAGRLDGPRKAARFPRLHVVVSVGAAGLAFLMTGSWVIAVIGSICARLPLFIMEMRRGSRAFDDPQFRAGLRRERIDCCIDCGQLMGGGTDEGTCPECGRSHQDFPLGWGPAPWRSRSWRTRA